MKIFKFFGLIALTSLVAACGGDNEVTVTNKRINGPFGDCFECVSTSSKFSMKEDKEDERTEATISFEFKRTKDGLYGPDTANFSEEVEDAYLICDFLDDNGNLVDEKFIGHWGRDMEQLFQLNVGDTKTYSVTFHLKKKDMEEFSKISQVKFSSNFTKKAAKDKEDENDGLSVDSLEASLDSLGL